MPTPSQRQSAMDDRIAIATETRAAQLSGIYMDQPVIYKHSTCYPIVNIREINYGEPHRHRETHSTPQGATQTSQPPVNSEHAEIIKQHEAMMKILENMQKTKMSGLNGDETMQDKYPLMSLIIAGVGGLAFGFIASKMFFGRK